jgi:pimeloyl-ACP methyl ester carboxylesterase
MDVLGVFALAGIGKHHMPHYRFYEIDLRGHIDSPPATEEFADDVAAISKAKRLLNGKTLEVWLGERLVMTLPAHADRSSCVG